MTDSIKKILIWLYMLTKRQLKKISFYIVLLIMLLSCIVIRYVGNNMTASIDIGIVREDNNEFSKNIFTDLLSHKGIVTFTEYSNEKELISAVIKNKVKGGYYFSKEFSKNVLAGKTSNCVKIIESPDDTISIITNEIIFSSVLKELSFEYLVEDTLKTELFDYYEDDEIRDKLRAYYNINLENGSTFKVNYDGGKFDEKKEYSKSDKEIYDYISPMIIGIVGIMIFLAALAGGINYYEDSMKGSFALMKKLEINAITLVEIFIPAIISSVFGAFLLYVTGMDKSLSHALIKLFLYAIIVTVYSFILTKIIKNKSAYIGIIPIFILISTIFCPVFMDVSIVFKGAEIIRKVLPLSYLM